MKKILLLILLAVLVVNGQGQEKAKDQPALFPEGKTFPVLGERFKVRMPKGAVSSARQESVMAAPEADDSETRLMIIDEENEMADLVFFIEEFYAFAGKTFKQDLEKQMKEVSEQIPITLSVKSVKTLGNLDFHMIVPSKIDIDEKRDGIRIRSGYLINTDNTVQHAAVYITPALAKKDLEGYIKKAEDIIMSITPGEKKLDTAGGLKELETLTHSRKAFLDIPKGYVLIKQPGPDFIVNRVFSMGEFGKDREASFSVYFGGHPASYDVYKEYRDEDHVKVEDIKGKLADMEVTWKRYTLKNRKTKETDYYLQVIHPLDDYWMMDISMRVKTLDQLEKVKKIAETLKIEKEDPQMTLLRERLWILEDMEIELPGIIKLIMARVKKGEKMTPEEITAANKTVERVLRTLKKELDKEEVE